MTTYLQGVKDQRGWALLRRAAALVALIWIPSSVLAYFLARIFPERVRDQELWGRPLMAIAGAILLAPMVETLVMRGLFQFLRKFTTKVGALAGISAFAWGLAHVGDEAWGLHALWGFWIMGLCYLALEPVSKDRAFLVTAGIHVALNTLSYILHLTRQHFGF